MLSDRQCDQLRDFVKSGGALMASFETSLYDENVNRRPDFGLSDLLGISKAGEAIGTNGNAYYARFGKSATDRHHPILNGFADTNWIPGAQNRTPLKPVKDSVLTVVPGFVRYPPELAYPPLAHTDEPAAVLREFGPGRTAFFSGDVERTYWLTGHGDLLRLMHNTIDWLTNGERVVHISGDGLIEMFCMRGTVGSNRFGPDPLADIEDRSASAASLAKSWDQQREIEFVPPSASPPGGMHVKRGA
jgi:hypothetical protein